ncbi:MAG: ABC transporter permease [Deltaproteobacteria bacterium]|nr:ABC transporter permease [Deltaproteobacteria bacterium]
MLRLILSRLVGGVGVIIAVATFSFLLLHAAPGGPFDAERALAPQVQRNIEARYHLDDSLVTQYADYMGGLAHGDFGYSLKRPMSVGEIITTHFPYSLTIGLMALLVAVGLGVGMGVIAAWRRNTGVDYALMSMALLGISIPSIVLGPILVGIFAFGLGWLPPARIEGPASYVLPAMCLGLIYLGTIARLARGSMLEVLGQDFVRTARAKGLTERAVVWKHALRLGVVPVVTYLGPATATLISGSFVIEKLFGVPGLGGFFVEAIVNRDYPVLSGVLVFYVAFLVMLNIVVDVVHGLLDPRIRSGR